MSVKCVDHLGNVYKSRARMCKDYGITIATLKYYEDKGYALGDILEGRVEKKGRSLGYDSKVLKRLADEYQIKYITLYNRLRKGMSLDAALNKGLKSCQKSVVFRGIQYDSIKAVACEYGFDANRITYWCSKGYTLNEALEKAVERMEFNVEDHKGNKYPTIKAMCDAWGIGYRQYYNLIRTGTYSLGEILEQNLGFVEHKTDHTGRVFSSVIAMCDYWGVKYYNYSYRIRVGWSKEEALTTPVKDRERRNAWVFNGDGGRRVDHNGREFLTLSEMCDYWGVPEHIFNRRLRDGWSLEEALITPVRTYGNKC